MGHMIFCIDCHVAPSHSCLFTLHAKALCLRASIKKPYPTTFNRGRRGGVREDTQRAALGSMLLSGTLMMRVGISSHSTEASTVKSSLLTAFLWSVGILQAICRHARVNHEFWVLQFVGPGLTPSNGSLCHGSLYSTVCPEWRVLRFHGCIWKSSGTTFSQC